MLPCKFSYLIQYDGDNHFEQHGRRYKKLLLDAKHQYKQPQPLKTSKIGEYLNSP